ncbi:sulfatase [Pontibacter sp. G13]|uniref:sulfatase n=1 Tax=Pontibacter sp. G13 TaxID=3074898 RepID=UPI00288BBC18|nr:sulfatase [Pontibacter sp. G13]WNJ20322.1 sulfatase [Pontibacter sp. G13]
MHFRLLPILALWVSSLAWTGCTQTADQAAPKLNVLLILADDLGAHDVGFMGSTYYETPNLDRLAAQGVVFTQGYSTCQVCSPARASIMTGEFTARHGITDWIGAKTGEAWRSHNRHDLMLPAEYEMQLPADRVTVAEALASEGYHTFFAGKWHIGGEGSHPEDHGFHINRGGFHAGSPKGGYFAPFKNPNLEDGPNGENLSMRLARETSEFIRSSADTPFFAMLSFYAVHGPIQTTEEKWAKYRDKAEQQGIAESGFEMEKKLPIRQYQDNPVYAGLVESMDDAIGEVLNTLEETGMMDNTLIIFTSDNGGVASGDAFSTSNAPLRGGKGYQWEGGLRVPLMVYLPNGAMKGGSSEVPATGADLYPTIMESIGAAAPEGAHLDGQSLLAILQGEQVTWADRPLYWHYPHYGNQGGDPSSVIRQGNWKWIYYHETQQGALYQLDQDPAELHNVADEHPNLAEKLHTQLQQWLADQSARMPAPDEAYDDEAHTQYHNKVVNKKWPALEKQRESMLSPDYQPNPDWWGSQVTID